MATYHHDRKSTSWVRTITSPFRKARTLFNQESSRDKKSHQEGPENHIVNLQVEVMACPYEDVQLSRIKQFMYIVASCLEVELQSFVASCLVDVVAILLTPKSKIWKIR
ncbi:hypothetical protein KY290_009706 [Solanum tuberosum]|uniref:Uncharacterized protein n=1 Tax=Solanum tuberosum TaxID=4113 RepID=A0ABQ7VVU4_SOLTU|nr:hypothetical protein KY290_009706 [Solanum tuberosum]